MEWQQQFNYVNLFDCHVTAVQWKIGTSASQNLVNLQFYICAWTLSQWAMWEPRTIQLLLRPYCVGSMW